MVKAGEQVSEQACSKGQVLVLNRAAEVSWPYIVQHSPSPEAYGLVAITSFKTSNVSKGL